MAKNVNSLIKKMGQKLKEKNLSLVTAESCTGGGLAYYISKSPECSSILERGYITYSHPSKINVLQVNEELLQTKGAVSKEVAIEMAIGALKNSNAQISISITGVAEDIKLDKPNPGIVWISCADIYGTKITRYKKIKGNRNIFIQKVIIEAITILLKYMHQFERKNKS